ncbi:hypothetical protein [Streptomyces monomycini]|uniref:hypothetical protein n=1 Tax=Streptomyces monomycini TaxID=371720 RepID=UPI0004AACF7B|nr:hypothetical protein [Streptomyces monomycini]
MDLFPSGLSLPLYGLTVVFGVVLLSLSISSSRSRRNAGFAAKSQLKRHLSAKSVVKATEVRPSLTRDALPASRPVGAVNLSKQTPHDES